jgi:hypothetical protein
MVAKDEAFMKIMKTRFLYFHCFKKICTKLVQLFKNKNIK